MLIADLLKLLGAYNKNYKVRVLHIMGDYEVVILDFNDHVIKVIRL